MLCSAGDPRQKLQFAFRMFDTDGDGTLTQREARYRPSRDTPL